MNHKLAAKAFISNEKGEILLVKRDPNNIQAPGSWEIPGGRLEEGEDPKEGLKREVKEETGLEIEIIIPFSTRHFTRTNGQLIDLIIYYAKNKWGKVKLSEEHTEFEWVKLSNLKEKIGPFFHQEVETINKIRNGKLFM
jgi:8-oxo-dGTP diphosphatase